MLRWIDAVDPASLNSDCPASGLERAAVCFGVDPPGEAGDDDDSLASQICRDAASHLFPINRCSPRTDDRDRGLGQHCDITTHQQQWRWIGECCEPCGVNWGEDRHTHRTGSGERGDLGGSVESWQRAR